MSSPVASLLDELTLEEKARLCSGRDFWHLQGIERLALPSLLVTDGPHGLRKQRGAADHVGLRDSVPATCFPTASGLAASWNPDLLHAVGRALGREAREESVSVLLGPGVNIKRHPLGGRNFEYFSEDPLLAGRMAEAWVNGVQAEGVGASLKHYAVNNHESGRMVVDVIVDERTLREIYLPAFERVVKHCQPWTVMCAYNKLGGTYLAEHGRLLNGVLRDEWGFEGLVISDWGAVNDRVQGLINGLDLEMPSSGEVNTRRILAAVEDGSLPEAVLDTAARRVLDLVAKAQSFSPAVPTQGNWREDHHRLARQSAEQACVLLKNEGGLLPLSGSSIAVIGDLAQRTRYQGGGSSKIQPTRLEQPLEAIRREAGGQVELSYASGCDHSGNSTAAQRNEALRVARGAEVVVLFLGLPPAYESEGFDRSHMDLPAGQLALVEALFPVADKLVVVLQNGAPVALPFADRVPAILEAYLGGQAGASALARILFGTVNPSGKLAETFPLSVNDVASDPFFPGDLRQSRYCEGIWVGYRFYATAGVPVLFPFGHGLSYTRFEYSELRIDRHPPSSPGSIRGTVNFTIANRGDRAGAEVAQLYVGQSRPAVPRPRRELRDFTRIELKPGEQREITLPLADRDFAFWDTASNAWRVENAVYHVEVGASCADIRLRGDIEIKNAHPPVAPDPALAPYFEPSKRRFNASSLAALRGRPIPSPVPARPFHLNSTLGEVQGTWLGGKLKQLMEREANKAISTGSSDSEKRMMAAIVDEMPLRNLVSQSQGRLPPGLMRAMIHIMNGAWGKLLRGAPVDAF